MKLLPHVLTTFEGALVAGRSKLIGRAMFEMRAWCAAPAPGQRPISDQHWVNVFANPTTGARDTHDFLFQYQLTRARNWDKRLVAAELNKIIAAPNFNTRTDIGTFALALKACLTSARASQQTSAASKFAMYSRLRDPIYIWDQLANRSTRLRQWGLGPRTNAFAIDKYYVNGKNHDYVAYSTACADALTKELLKPDFNAAVNQIVAFLTQTGGPMGNPAIVSRQFIERRFLDKLMFVEGDWLRKWEDEWKPIRKFHTSVPSHIAVVVCESARGFDADRHAKPLKSL